MFHAIKFLALCAILLPIVAHAQPLTIHDDRRPLQGSKGERVDAFLEAFNANSTEAVERLMNEHVTDGFRTMAPIEQHVKVIRGTYRQTGGIDFYSVRTYEPAKDQTVIIVKDRIYNGWHSLVLEFDGTDERISNINFTRARPPADAAGPTLTEADMIDEARAAVRRGCEYDAFSGTVLVARGDKVLFETACGEASKRFDVPNNIDTKFNIGSMNKMFTATAIMQLVDSGRIAVDDTISHYVDETWLPKEITDKVTIHHLLTHTSGLGSYFNDAFMKSSRMLYRDLEDYKPLLESESLAFEPGAQFKYSNTGMFVLGVVIESVTGQSYFDYVRENVYHKADMTNSDSYSMDEPVPNLAIGYIPAHDSEYGWRNNIFDHVIKGGPAGGGFSTVRDLHQYATAMLNGELLSDEKRRLMWTNHSGTGYGYGFGVSDGSTGKMVGHSGGFPGLNGSLELFPESEYVIAVLSNYDRAASPLADKLRGLVGRVDDVTF